MMSLKIAIFCIGLFLIFMSGATPYSLVYNESGLEYLGEFEGPIDDSKFTCQTDKEVYEPGEPIDFTFSYEISNPTNRYVIFTVIADIMPPKRETITKYKNVLLSPNETYQSIYTASIKPFPNVGNANSPYNRAVYGCEVRANIGFGNYK